VLLCKARWRECGVWIRSPHCGDSGAGMGAFSLKMFMRLLIKVPY